MAKKFDKIIVVDLEATCWDQDTEEGRAEQGDQVSEIIELGACAWYPESGNITDPISYYVRPTTSRISEYCTNLTGYDWPFIRKNGIPLQGALNKFRKEFGPKHRVMAAWGNYDWWMISEQCLREDIAFPFGKSFINVKELHAFRRRMSKSLGLGAALTHEELEFVGKPHQGCDDAFNTAKILKLIL